MSDKIVGYMARAVLASSVVGLGLALLVMIDTGQTWPAAFGLLAVASGIYARSVMTAVATRGSLAPDADYLRVGTLSTS